MLIKHPQAINNLIFTGLTSIMYSSIAFFSQNTAEVTGSEIPVEMDIESLIFVANSRYHKFTLRKDLIKTQLIEKIKDNSLDSKYFCNEIRKRISTLIINYNSMLYEAVKKNKKQSLSIEEKKIIESNIAVTEEAIQVLKKYAEEIELIAQDIPNDECDAEKLSHNFVGEDIFEWPDDFWIYEPSMTVKQEASIDQFQILTDDHHSVDNPKRQSDQRTKSHKRSNSIVDKKSQTFFSNTYNGIQIKTDPTLTTYIRKLENSGQPEKVEEAKKLTQRLQFRESQIRSLIPKLLINSQILNKINDSKVRVYISTAEFLNRLTKSRAAYDSNQNIIYIRLFGPDVSDLETIDVLRNEFSHVMVVDTNTRKLTPYFPQSQVKAMDKGLPFLNIDGEIDPLQQKNLQLATEEYLSNIVLLKKLHKLEVEGKRIPKGKIQFYESAKKSIKNFYHPSEFPSGISQQFLQELYQTGKIKESPTNSEFLFIPKRLAPRGELWIAKSALKDSEPDFILCRHAAEDILQAFLADHQGTIAEYSDKGAYTTISAPHQLTELVSDIDAIPNGIKEVLAPNLCKYFSEYHAVNSYCSM